MSERYVTFFPYGDFCPGGGYVSYGPFSDLAAAKAHARTLSSDPDEGEVAKLVHAPGADTGENVPPEAVLAAMRSIVDYDWQVEQRDYEEQGEPDEGHVFLDLQLVDGWLTGKDATPDSGISFKTGELQKLYDLLVLEAEGREEQDLDDDPEIDSAFAKIAKEIGRRS